MTSFFGQNEEYMASAALNCFKNTCSPKSIKKFQEIDKKINWRPTLFFSAHRFEIIALDVSPSILSPILKQIAYEVIQIHKPISIYCVCPEDSYLNKSNQKKIREARECGFGIISVDDEGNADKKLPCIPLIQQIPNNRFEDLTKSLPIGIKRQFHSAFETYRSNHKGGLTQATEIVEGLVQGLADSAVKKGLLPPIKSTASFNMIINSLFSAPALKQEEACKGAIHYFRQTYRNMSHHAPKSYKKAYERYSKSKTGFEFSISVASTVCDTSKKIGIKPKIIVS